MTTQTTILRKNSAKLDDAVAFAKVREFSTLNFTQYSEGYNISVAIRHNDENSPNDAQNNSAVLEHLFDAAKTMQIITLKGAYKTGDYDVMFTIQDNDYESDATLPSEPQEECSSDDEDDDVDSSEDNED